MNNRTDNWKKGSICGVIALALVIISLLSPWDIYEEEGRFSYSGYSGDWYIKREYSLRSPSHNTNR